MYIVTEKSKESIAEICGRFNILKLALFGSATRDDFGPTSDIDLLVYFEPEKTPSLGMIVVLQDELTELLGRRVHLATPSILRNPYRKRAIEKDLKELYAA